MKSFIKEGYKFEGEFVNFNNHSGYMYSVYRSEVNFWVFCGKIFAQEKTSRNKIVEMFLENA